MDDPLHIGDNWYTPATSTRADGRTRVLKHDDTFALFDSYGDIQTIGSGEHGIYHEGTRFLSRLELLLEGRRPLLLNSTIKSDNSLLAIDLTNQDLYNEEKLVIPKGTVHIFRGVLLWQGVCYQQLRLTNHSLLAIHIGLSLRFDADFNDIFEVRGVKRESRGSFSKPVVEANGFSMRYKGLDGVTRRTTISAQPAPSTTAEGRFDYKIDLASQAEIHLYNTIRCEIGDKKGAPVAFSHALDSSTQSLNAPLEQGCRITTSNPRFNDWIARSSSDLRILVTETGHGAYPCAGVPWFSTPFGRDGIITALETLWFDSSLARGVLLFLAENQASKCDPARDAEPGKILHKMRRGEMAALAEIPFGCHYGSVDATPLFILLASQYYRRTHDRKLVKKIWPNIVRALDWIDQYGDSDGDGFVEYSRHSREGLTQQGWKDSDDAISYPDGRLVEGPVALCEVQAYVYAAKLGAAEIAEELGEKKRAAELRGAAQELKTRFNKAFWSSEIKTFALALDGEKRSCPVISSNAGYALLAGIASPDHARRAAQGLMSEDCFSGWGIRTLGRSTARYNPMSYHNGSVWPHDTALIAKGMARYGYADFVDRIFCALYDASNLAESNRLPELFCGFSRRHGEGPVCYPVACLPQAWASAAVFCLLDASLGVSFTSESPGVAFHEPRLPAFLDSIEIRKLQVYDGFVDVCLHRQGDRPCSVKIMPADQHVEHAAQH